MKRTQEATVKNHLDTYGKISTWDAFQEYGITRLSAVIFNLKRNGLDITTDYKSTTTRLGNKTQYAEYKLVK